jgi:hypothetical protein
MAPSSSPDPGVTTAFEKWASQLKLGKPQFSVTPCHDGGSRQIGFRCKLTVPGINYFGIIIN